MKPSDNDPSSLPREMTPPPQLEDRVVASLRSEGLLDHPGGWVRRAAAAAAAVLIFFGGYAVGGARSPQPAASSPTEPGNRYAILLYEDGQFMPAPADDPGRHVREYGAWAMNLAAMGALDDAGELASTGVSLLPAGDTGLAEVPTSPTEGGPVEVPISVSSGDVPTGFFVVRAASLDAARDIALTHPHLANRGRVDVHPVVGRGGDSR